MPSSPWKKAPLFTIAALVFVSSVGLIFPPPALATNSCPPHPCRDGSGQFVQKHCEAQSDWIAIGSISGVIHDRQGHPLNKNFSKFVFTPSNWQKVSANKPKQFTFKVGWCHNTTELPEDYSGAFRFYGLNSKTLDGHSIYLDFEKVP